MARREKTIKNAIIQFGVETLPGTGAAIWHRRGKINEPQLHPLPAAKVIPIERSRQMDV